MEVLGATGTFTELRKLDHLKRTVPERNGMTGTIFFLRSHSTTKANPVLCEVLRGINRSRQAILPLLASPVASGRWVRTGEIMRCFLVFLYLLQDS
ncbi:MAG: hypothetical protein ACYTXA_05915 [Nostoc sp.]